MYDNYVVTSRNKKESAEEFSKQLIDSYNKTCPIGYICINETKHDNSWITDEIRKSLKFKRFLYRL